jgi:hypothetical protein
MTTAMTESRIFQNIGRVMYFDAARAPKPIAVNQMTLAIDAPRANSHRWEAN